MRYWPLYLLAFLVYISAATWASSRYALLVRAAMREEHVRPINVDYGFGAAFGVTFFFLMLVGALLAWLFWLIKRKRSRVAG